MERDSISFGSVELYCVDRRCGGGKLARGGVAYREKPNGIDGELIILGVSHDCGLTECNARRERGIWMCR